MSKKMIITITGPTGSGKSTLEKNLQLKFPDLYKKVISCTTRSPREGEEHGKDYYFMSKEDFDKTVMIERVEFGGNGYGVPAFEMDTHKDVIIVVETGGAIQIQDYVRDFMPERTLVKIFMDIPTKVCQDNIRASTPKEEAEKRIARHDPIRDEWKASELEAEITVKQLSENLDLAIQERLTLLKESI